ncbi:MAG: TlpA family protein disulfide reductase [Bacteroidetes bacterium]|nr:TlpA family protein disulfide reductase [Bacteroidota bacterium]
MKLLRLSTVLFFFLIANVHSQSIDTLLHKTLYKINLLNCVKYQSKSGSSAPYDSVIMHQYISYNKIINEPNDAIIGARFLLYLDDTTKIYLSYYNSIISRYDWNKKSISIDTLNKGRPTINTPFFIKVKGLLKYIIENKDSVLCQVNEYTDSIKFSFTFINKLVELDKTPVIYPKAKAVSKYFLWVKRDFMPYKLKRQLPHQTSYEEIISLTNSDSTEIIEKQIGIYMPEGFNIKDKKGQEITTTVLEGKEAPNWILKNIEGKSISIFDYKGKNLLIEFTGTGCGYCHLAIPFLNKFTSEYKDKGFRVVSIESFSDNIERLKQYKDVNQMNYEFLISDKTTVANYKILGVPVFILVNKSGKIEKAFIGYTKDETDKLIMAVADKM